MVGGTIQNRRLLELDAMRGIAAMLVLLYHFNFKYEPRDLSIGELPLLFGWGHHGVSLFFAISGFVISMTLERTTSVSAFAWSRFSRLFPVYWAAMAITIIVVLIGNDQKLMVSPQVALANATMMHYWFDIQSVDGSYWSLSIELSFYLVMALVLHLRLLQRLELVLAGWLALHILQGMTGVLPIWAARMVALDYIPLFAIGMIHYRYFCGMIDWRRAVAWHLALVAIVALSGTSAAIVAAATACLFWAMTHGWLGFMKHPLLLWLGAISYPLYLIHQYVGYVLIDHLTATGMSLLAATGVALVTVIALAHMLHIWVENPSQVYLRDVRKTRLAPAE
ncbi:MAG: acyltransferase, partial [Sphingorhabdus sp.]